METLTVARSSETKHRRPNAILRTKIAALILANLMATATTAVAVQPSTQSFDQARDYVFAACIMLRYPDTPIAVEADAWAAGLIENGDLAADDYKALSVIATKAPEPPVTRNGIVMRLQSCANLANDTATARRIRRLLLKSVAHPQ